MTYVVHGATGAQGSPVFTALAAKGLPVAGIARRAEAALGPGRALAVDLASRERLESAYRGADGVFVHLPVADPKTRNAYAANIVAALSAARPKRVVYSTSGFPADADPVAAALRDSGLSHAVIAPRYFFENLLLPAIQEGVRAEGVLRYPLAEDFAASWSSHLDVADAAAALFDRGGPHGVVEVGQYPAVTGKDLAAAFATAYGREVVYEPMTPSAFGALLAPLMGDQVAAAVRAGYEQVAGLPHNSIGSERSAQRLLGLTPRSPLEWLVDLGPREA